MQGCANTCVSVLVKDLGWSEVRAKRVLVSSPPPPFPLSMFDSLCRITWYMKGWHGWMIRRDQRGSTGSQDSLRPKTQQLASVASECSRVSVYAHALNRRYARARFWSIMAAGGEALFEAAVSAVLRGWPALKMAVSNQFGGPQSQAKATWMEGATAQWMRENGVCVTLHTLLILLSP